MLQIKNISKEYGVKQILSDVSFVLDKNEKVAIVGKNGAGKSTLLKILSGKEDYDSGEIKIPNGSKISYLPQVVDVINDKQTSREYIREGSVKTEDFEIEKVAAIFKLEEKLLDSPLNQLSGGQKTKIALIKTLLTNADFILLDEPTNNLDLESLLWLETFIKNSKSSFIIVSHDRRFLDNVSDKVIEITSEGTVNVEKGSYTEYLKRMEDKIERNKLDYINQQSEICKLQETIEDKKKAAAKGAKYAGTDNDKMLRNFKRENASGSAKEAKRMEKRIEQMEKVEKPENYRPLEINISESWKTGDRTITARSLKIGVGDFEAGPFNFDIRYGDKVCFIGSNGAGKTTLIKTILNEYQPKSGEISIGSKISFGNLTQEHENLPLEKTLLEFIELKTGLEEHLIYNLLKKFNFREDQFRKKIETLSPGEQTRLLLALFSEQEINTLILDEPSNHLDIEALGAIEEAVSNYNGTVIIISHDRYLIEKIKPDTIYEVTKEKLNLVLNYNDYINSIISF